jgi:hypothetical protein
MVGRWAMNSPSTTGTKMNVPYNAAPLIFALATSKALTSADLKQARESVAAEQLFGGQHEVSSEFEQISHFVCATTSLYNNWAAISR